MAKSLFDVISRTAAKFAFLTSYFPNLRQGRFDKCGGGTYDSHEPHPENCARTAQGNCGSNARYISSANTARGRNHKRLKRRNGLFTIDMFLFRNLPKHVFQITNLHALGSDREINTGNDKQNEQNIGVHKAIDISR